MATPFGDQLRKYRKNAGLTLGELARAIGVSVSYLSDVERGNRGPFAGAHLERAAEALNLDTKILKVVASESRGAYSLEPLSPAHQNAGAALMRSWSTLPPAKLARIVDLVEDDDEA